MISAFRLAGLCADAYVQPPSLEAADAHVILAEVDGVVIVAFRGSKSLTDWWTDFKCLPHVAIEHPELGPCHAGFLADACAIAPLIIAEVGDRPLLICGHSKGAAEATLFAALLVAARKPPAGLWLFGSPRVAAPGNTALAGLISGLPGSSYRHRDDPVPLVPLGFFHPRPIVQLVPPRFEFDPIADHFISGYAAALTY